MNQLTSNHMQYEIIQGPVLIQLGDQFFHSNNNIELKFIKKDQRTDTFITFSPSVDLSTQALMSLYTPFKQKIGDSLFYNTMKIYTRCGNQYDLGKVAIVRLPNLHFSRKIRFLGEMTLHALKKPIISKKRILTDIKPKPILSNYTATFNGVDIVSTKGVHVVFKLKYIPIVADDYGHLDTLLEDIEIKVISSPVCQLENAEKGDLKIQANNKKINLNLTNLTLNTDIFLPFSSDNPNENTVEYKGSRVKDYSKIKIKLS